jgi:DNA polymerase III subunit epsilon
LTFSTFIILAILAGIVAAGAWMIIQESAKSGPTGLRSIARSTAQQILKQSADWVVVDTETTGIGQTDVVLQIAVVSSTGEVLLDTLTSLPPRKRISAKAQEKHGITRQALKDAPDWATVRILFDQVVAGRQCLAYNSAFDSRLIRQTDEAHQVQGVEHRWVDVMPVYNAWCSEWDPRRKKVKWQKLPSSDHTASGDCKAVLEVLKKIAA